MNYCFCFIFVVIKPQKANPFRFAQRFLLRSDFVLHYISKLSVRDTYIKMKNRVNKSVFGNYKTNYKNNKFHTYSERNVHYRLARRFD